ncbi:hypothetical protein VCHC80A1_01376 [Vibrio cholerae HC-80A1]|nr:hypothetical protein VCHC80A1_01376 [Vibrio cholerae HC-80A1]
MPMKVPTKQPIMTIIRLVGITAVASPCKIPSNMMISYPKVNR